MAWIQPNAQTSLGWFVVVLAVEGSVNDMGCHTIRNIGNLHLGSSEFELMQMIQQGIGRIRRYIQQVFVIFLLSQFPQEGIRNDTTLVLQKTRCVQVGIVHYTVSLLLLLFLVVVRLAMIWHLDKRTRCILG